MNAPTVNIANLRVACSSCNLRELCLPVGLSLKDIEKLEELVATRKKVKRGDSLFRAGDRFQVAGWWHVATMSKSGCKRSREYRHLYGLPFVLAGSIFA
jgi:hypothetical protein